MSVTRWKAGASGSVVLLPESAGDCLSAKLRRGDEHSAEDWDELLVPKIERLQTKRRQGTFRADLLIEPAHEFMVRKLI